MELVKKTFTRILIILSFFLFYSPQLMAGGVVWTSPATISTSNKNASDPQVGLDNNGNVVAVWVENGFVISKTLPVNGSWSSPTTLSGSGASIPQLVVDGNGNANAIWIENGVVNVASKALNGSWSAATALSSSGASSPQIALDTNGNVVAVWVLNGVIQSATHLFGGSWPGSPDDLSGSGMDYPQVAIGANGNVVAVWHGVFSSMDTVFAANKSISGTWNAPEQISSASYNCVFPKIDVDLNGNAIAVWFRYQVANTVYSDVVLQAATCPYSDSWTAPIDLSRAGLYDPASLFGNVYYDGHGNAIACWNISYDGSSFSYEVATLPAGGIWSQTIDLLSQNLYAYAIDLAVDAYGHAFAVYMLNNTSQPSVEIQCRKMDIFALGPAWCTSFASLSSGSYNGYPQAAAVSNGNQIYSAAVWLSYNGSNTTIQAATGAGIIFSPPSNLAVVQNSYDKFLFTTYCNTLSWQPSTDPKVKGYYIYRNGKPILGVPPDVSQMIDENRIPGESVTYGVSAYYGDFSQSQVVNITYP